jgi:hypothetical protein
LEKMGLSSLNTTNIYNIIPKLKTRDEEKFSEPFMIKNKDTILQVINIQPLNFKGQRMSKVELIDATKEQKIQFHLDQDLNQLANHLIQIEEQSNKYLTTDYQSVFLKSS